MRTPTLLLASSLLLVGLTTVLAPSASACGYSQSGPQTSQTTTHTVSVDDKSVTVGYTITHTHHTWSTADGDNAEPCKTIATVLTTVPSGVTPIVHSG